MSPDQSSCVGHLADRWHGAVLRTVGNVPHLSVLFSGGVDSSLVAWSAAQLSEVELVTVGVPGSQDLLSAEAGARLLGLPWRHREVTPADLDRLLPEEDKLLGDASPGSRPVLLGLAFALETARRELVLCGQGADELFLGYRHFDGVSPAVVESRRRRDLDRLLREDWPLTSSIAERRGKRVASPFLDSEFLDYASSIPIELLSAGPNPKELLRQLARALGVPRELTERAKKAFQYGSGIERLLRAHGDGA
jgi:asparagine synthase (glutamine-hydrolysing)